MNLVMKISLHLAYRSPYIVFEHCSNFEIDIIMETGYDMGMKKKKIIALALVGSLLIFAPNTFWADTASQKKNEAQTELDKVNSEIDGLESQQAEVNAELSDVEAQLAVLMEQQEALQVEIATTETDIAQTAADLEVAQAEAEEQYDAMVLRIQYMYENSSVDSFWTAILEADGFVDMLRRVEYVATIQAADRELTAEYEAVVKEVEAKEEELLVKMDELLMQEEAFIGQQVEIEAMIAELEEEQGIYESYLADARAQAAEYEDIIAEQNAILAAQATTSGGKTGYTGQNVSGDTLVAYALQFVGNPYVWGGNSLTNGCDCSGFVHEVYEYFGYNLVRHSTSFLKEGVAVSLDEIQAGDIVVYYPNSSGVGHVAIYIGNGKIVEAQSTKAGITSNRAVDCRPIMGIRRVLGQ